MHRPTPTFLRALLAVALVSVSIGLAAGAPPAQPAPFLQITRDGEPGTSLVITGVIVDREGRGVRDAELHLYQTDAAGRYTPDKPMDEPHARLAGFLKSPDGRFELRTIRPGGYTKMVRLGDRDRQIPPHIHIDISCPGHAERRLQVVFTDDPLLSDPHWADWVIKLRQPVVKVVRDAAGWHGHLLITLD